MPSCNGTWSRPRRAVWNKSTSKVAWLFNGIFGYLSIGKAGAGGRHKMYNAPVIFALRGSNYTPQSGFELDTEPYIGEYSTYRLIVFGKFNSGCWFVFLKSFSPLSTVLLFVLKQ